jgi:D-alanyl-lipoteichoic acid acyltransferase DltB (MBOAT superfamily)
MLFTDIVFAPFLVLTFVAFALFAGRLRGQLLVLLAASYVFYGWWDARFLILIVFSSLLDFQVGRAIHRSHAPRRRLRYLQISLVGNLGLLAYFKYANFFIESLQAALTNVGLDPHLPTLSVLLPVGISFYTFQTLSYSLDIYYRRLAPTDSLLAFMVYVAAFPQLVAGPIVRARDFLPQLRESLFARSDPAGVVLVLYGLSKKLFVADPLGRRLVDPLFASPGAHGSIDALLAIHAYSFQIFLDFSAYSDIAIGLGLLFGLQLPVNFREPYSSRNPAEFWRRWHITLSSWLRDYLYIPLGGNRIGPLRTYVNLMLVMLIGGLWHGAAWTFVGWGALHGLYLVVHRTWRERRDARGARGTADSSPLLVRLVSVFVLFELVTVTWILFRAPTLDVAIDVAISALTPSTSATLATAANMGLIALAVAIHFLCESRIHRIAAAFGRLHYVSQGLLVYAALALLFLGTRSGASKQAFIYFQF